MERTFLQNEASLEARIIAVPCQETPFKGLLTRISELGLCEYRPHISYFKKPRSLSRGFFFVLLSRALCEWCVRQGTAPAIEPAEIHPWHLKEIAVSGSLRHRPPNALAPSKDRFCRAALGQPLSGAG